MFYELNIFLSFFLSTSIDKEPLFCTLRFLESSIRKNPYVQNTHSCSKNAVIGKQPLRSGNVGFEIMK